MCWCGRCLIVRLVSVVMIIFGFCIDMELGAFAVLGALIMNVFMEILNETEKEIPRTSDRWPPR